MTLGQRLKHLRGTRTQQEIADKLDISRSRYSHYENNYVEIDHSLLQKIADLHNVSVDYLLGREFNEGKTINDEESNLIDKFRNLNTMDRNFVSYIIERLNKK